VKSGAVLYIKDRLRMRSFYEGCFVMRVVDDTDDYCVLESEVLTLSLVVVPGDVGATIVLSTPPAPRVNVPIKLVFPVDRIEHSRIRLAELGGLVEPATSEWEFRGRVHCDGLDPEGNVLQLVQEIAEPLSETDPRRSSTAFL
jgi:predicted enzyme related to lactoylglutathione lyase